MKKKMTAKQKIGIGLLTVAPFVFTACPKDGPVDDGDPCNCGPKTHYVEDLTGENCCASTECDSNCCTIISEPTSRTFPLTGLFEGNTATVTDARTNVGRNLNQLVHNNATVDIPTKIKTAINAGFDTAAIPPLQAPWKNVFGSNVTIIVENNVTYTSYEADNGNTLRFNVAYLLSASAADLESAIADAVAEMNILPLARSAVRETIRMAKASVDAKAFAKSVVAQLPQGRAAIQQRVMLDRSQKQA